MKPLVRWTIGPVRPDGFDCLHRSIDSFLKLYDVEVAICHNCPDGNNLVETYGRFRLVDQRNHLSSVPPLGVAWKLYPPRLAPNRHEILIDNDLVVKERIEQIDQFLSSDCTLMLEDHARAYGRFDRHIRQGLLVNSGLFGMPPGFDMQKYIDFYVGESWERNATGIHKENGTFDEQGLVAIALSSYESYVTIPSTCITNCEQRFVPGKGHHFVGLNRRNFHQPYRQWKHRHSKLYL